MVDWSAMLAATPPRMLAGTLRRLVESQEQVATSRLVSSLTRQAQLEEMIEATKPALRPGTENLHYLLAAPFRYPPLKHGSRFGRRSEPSLFYGSLETRTVLAEAAFYRFVFWYDMARPPPEKLDTQHTLFGAQYRTERGLELQEAPFAQHEAVLIHRADYRQTQALGSSLRAADIEAFEFISARDPDHGLNVALASPAAFANPRPIFQEVWLAELTGEHVRFKAAHGNEVYDFMVETFQINGWLPRPSA
ncbi:MAG: RES family NAD+ phosphorylase [Chromatocurvus sp.]